MSTLNEIAQAAHANARAKGFWDDCVTDGALYPEAVVAKIPEKLCLIHSEVSEALEDFREGNMETVAHYSSGRSAMGCPKCDCFRENSDIACRNCGHLAKPVGFPSELADILIRTLEFAAALGLDMDREVAVKMAYNATRPVRHGGKRV